jgi:hypothetical protein
LDLGGYWYLHFYPAERAVILQGPWPFAHNLFHGDERTPVPRHRPARLSSSHRHPEKLHSNSAARKLVLSLAGLIAITGLAVEGAGAVIDHGVKVALLRKDAR